MPALNAFILSGSHDGISTLGSPRRRRVGGRSGATEAGVSLKRQRAVARDTSILAGADVGAATVSAPAARASAPRLAVAPIVVSSRAVRNMRRPYASTRVSESRCIVEARAFAQLRASTFVRSARDWRHPLDPASPVRYLRRSRPPPCPRSRSHVPSTPPRVASVLASACAAMPLAAAHGPSRRRPPAAPPTSRSPAGPAPLVRAGIDVAPTPKPLWASDQGVLAAYNPTERSNLSLNIPLPTTSIRNTASDTSRAIGASWPAPGHRSQRAARALPASRAAEPLDVRAHVLRRSPRRQPAFRSRSRAATPIRCG